MKPGLCDSNKLDWNICAVLCTSDASSRYLYWHWLVALGLIDFIFNNMNEASCSEGLDFHPLAVASLHWPAGNIDSDGTGSQAAGTDICWMMEHVSGAIQEFPLQHASDEFLTGECASVFRGPTSALGSFR